MITSKGQRIMELSPPHSLLQIYETMVGLLMVIFRRAASFGAQNQAKELEGGNVRKLGAWPGDDFC